MGQIPNIFKYIIINHSITAAPAGGLLFPNIACCTCPPLSHPLRTNIAFTQFFIMVHKGGPTILHQHQSVVQRPIWNFYTVWNSCRHPRNTEKSGFHNLEGMSDGTAFLSLTGMSGPLLDSSPIPLSTCHLSAPQTPLPL